MNPVLLLLVMWLAFAATHMALSSAALRPRLASAIGERPFLALYSVVAFALFVPLVWIYFEHKHEGGPLWALPPWPPLRWLLYALNGLAFTLIVAGLLRPSPTAVTAGPAERPRGVQHLTRHPVFMGIGLWGLAHLAANGFATDVVFFAGFPLLAVIGAWHQDRRKRAALGEPYRRFCAESPFLPFTGRHTARGLRELSPLALALGIGLTVVLRVFHPALFG